MHLISSLIVASVISSTCAAPIRKFYRDCMMYIDTLSPW